MTIIFQRLDLTSKNFSQKLRKDLKTFTKEKCHLVAFWDQGLTKYRNITSETLPNEFSLSEQEIYENIVAKMKMFDGNCK